MSGIVRLVPGTDFARLVTLYKGKVTFDMSTATCKVRVVSADSSAALSSEVALSSGAAGADWSASKIALIIPSAATSSINVDGAARIEIKVNQDGVDDHWWISIDIVEGHVS
jgi:hypothetical protein